MLWSIFCDRNKDLFVESQIFMEPARPPYTYAYPYANAFAYAYAHADADAYAYACASTYAYDYAYAWLCSLIVREHNSAQCLFLETLPQK